ncbi:MAG: 16S rRNA (guanine(966)-N(2))-methyltransferase RsmD [Clostridia bacterium]|nr:16S rRNA (guanine(966)-N(2))-methyltransferase RsmD [Clostridia bacterium]
MRITGGIYRGMKLTGPSHHGLRPAMDRIREALFNILAGFFVGGSVLDLFAGSGSLGIEALSRGAESVLFVEKDPRSLRVLRQNLQLLQSRGEWDGTKQIQVWPGDVFQVLPRLRGEGRKFDLILADPPFPADLWMKILETVDGSQVLAEDGLLVMQVRRDRTLPERVGELTRCRRRIYGETSLEFWRCAR